MRLFDPIVEPALQHPNFRSLLELRNGFTLDVLNDWANGFVDRDRKFVREFQTTFNSSFWELYVFAVLKKFGLRPDFSKSSPDFCLPNAHCRRGDDGLQRPKQRAGIRPAQQSAAA
jgi:hypothetical protein